MESKGPDDSLCMHGMIWICTACACPKTFFDCVADMCSNVYEATCSLKPLYNTVHYNMVLDIIQIIDGSQKCIDYI